MPQPRLLITGFGPFPRVPSNPSAVLARRVAASPRLRRMLGGAPDVRILSTTYAGLSDELEPALARAPAAVLMFGVAARAKRVRVEDRARNRTSQLSADAAGRTPARITLETGAPAARTSPVAPVIVRAMHGIGARASRDAGRYLCNAAYLRVLALGCPAVFVHIPPLPRTSAPRHRTLEAWCAAAIEAARLLLVCARRQSGLRPLEDTLRASPVAPGGGRR